MAQALKPLFDAIVDAIHEKDGKTDGIAASDFPARIRAIPTDLVGVRLESITIVTPPTKTAYAVGETFDPAGMVVSASFSNGQSMYVDHSNLTFDPSGPLELGTTSVTVSFQWGLKLASTSQGVSVGYHYEWWSPHMTADNVPAPYVASASSIWNASYPAWKAFDGTPSRDVNGTGGIWMSADMAGSSWIQLDFGVPAVIKGLRINIQYSGTNMNNEASAPNRFYVSGSSDGQEWAEVANFTNISWAGMGQYKDFEFEQAARYRYFRIGANDITSSESYAGRMSFGDIQFYKAVTEQE